MEQLLAFAISSIITGIIIFISGKVTDVQITVQDAIICVIASSLCSLIPGYIGTIASLAALFYLLKHFSGADIWPDLILMVIVSKIVTVIALMGLANLAS